MLEKESNHCKQLKNPTVHLVLANYRDENFDCLTKTDKRAMLRSMLQKHEMEFV